MGKRQHRRGQRHREAMKAKSHSFRQVVSGALASHLNRGKVTIMDVYHDEDCTVFSTGTCRCSPDIRLTTPVSAREEDSASG